MQLRPGLRHETDVASGVLWSEDAQGVGQVDSLHPERGQVLNVPEYVVKTVADA
jgi:hypothetical protein